MAKNKFTNKGSLFVAIAAILWSFDGVLRRGLYTLPPTIVVFFEHLLGAVILLFAVKKWLPEVKTLDKKGWIAISAVALFSGALGTIFYTAALGQINYIQFSVVVLLQQLQPIWAVSAAILLLKEHVSKRFYIWAGVALVGAYIVAFRDLEVNIQEGMGTIIAAFLALGAGLMWGTSTAISKYVLLKLSFLAATALRFILTSMFSLIIVLVLGQTSQLTTVTPDQWQSLLLITFTTGMVSLLIYYYGLKRIPAHVSTIIELLFPLSAIVIDYVYFQNPLSTTQIIGSIILLFAIYNVVKLKNETKNITSKQSKSSHNS